jgi:hypothetical protein
MDGSSGTGGRISGLTNSSGIGGSVGISGTTGRVGSSGTDGRIGGGANEIGGGSVTGGANEIGGGIYGAGSGNGKVGGGSNEGRVEVVPVTDPVNVGGANEIGGAKEGAGGLIETGGGMFGKPNGVSSTLLLGVGTFAEGGFGNVTLGACGGGVDGEVETGGRLDVLTAAGVVPGRR